jgi:hypothetical protein
MSNLTYHHIKIEIFNHKHSKVLFDNNQLNFFQNLKSEFATNNNNMNLPNNNNTNNENDTGDYRTGTLKIESIINVNKLSRPKRKPNSQRKQPQQIENEVEIRQAELGEGILHLYRDKDDFPIVKTEQPPGPSTSASTSALTSLNSELIKTNEQAESKKLTSIQNFEEGNVVGLLAIPSYMAPCDLLNFITPEFTKSIHQIRLIR